MSAPPSGVDNARVVLRPIGSPLPLGLLGLFVATFSFSALQLGWLTDVAREPGVRKQL